MRRPPEPRLLGVNVRYIFAVHQNFAISVRAARHTEVVFYDSPVFGENISIQRLQVDREISYTLPSEITDSVCVLVVAPHVDRAREVPAKLD